MAVIPPRAAIAQKHVGFVRGETDRPMRDESVLCRNWFCRVIDEGSAALRR